MPLMSSRASGSVRAFGLTILSALTSVIDTFNRSNQSGLGTAKGQRWKIWRGAWEILNNTANSSSVPSTHALATLNFTKTDVTISVSGAGPGMGTAFWVSDANNWWAATYEQVYSCQTCGGCAGYNTPSCCAFNTVPANPPSPPPGGCPPAGSVPGNPGNPGNPCCNSCVPKTTPPVGFCQQTYNPYSRNLPNPPNPPSPQPPCVLLPGNPATYPCSGNCFNFFCSAPFTFSCNCTTAHSIKILSAIASTISTAASSAFSSTIASFRAVLSGNNVTIRAYSDSSWASQIGSDWNTNLTSPNKNKAHGIIKSPATFSQSSSIDEFRVS